MASISKAISTWGRTTISRGRPMAAMIMKMQPMSSSGLNKYQVMKFQREWDTSCPREWSRWEADGKTWVVQDLPPEDDETAIQMLLDHWLPDELLSISSDLLNDPVSLESLKQAWRQILTQRVALGCYTNINGQMTLVGLNLCYVLEKGKASVVKLEGRAALNAYGVEKYFESKCDIFDQLKVDKVLSGLGLVVAREYRGSSLGGRILAAREALCKSQGIKGSAGMFAEPASQKLGTNCGYTTISEATWSELADSGLDYPREDKVVKFMIKKYE